MIAAVPGPGGMTLRGEVPPGSVLYVDADWVQPEGGAVAALQVADGADPDAQAVSALAQLVEEARGVVAGIDPARVAVTGSGAVAAGVRLAIGGAVRSDLGGDAELEAVVDLTGDPAVIQRACERLADLGVLVLAGEPLGRAAPFNLYADVHLRGLRLVGVAPAVVGARATEGPASPHIPPPAPIAPGEPLPPAGWYRLS